MSFVHFFVDFWWFNAVSSTMLVTKGYYWFFCDICSPIVSIPFRSWLCSADNDDMIVRRTWTEDLEHVATSSQEQ